MKRVLTISAQRNSEDLIVVNTMQHGDFPGKNDVSQTIRVNQRDYLALVGQDSGLPLLPQNVRWCSSDRRSLLIEEPPNWKTFRFRSGAKLDMSSKMAEYNLPMPWLYYGISPDKNKQPFVSHLWCAPTPIAGNMYEKLYFLPIPNVFKTGAICTHTLSEEISDLPYHLQVNNAISQFWDSVFNHDVNHYGNSTMYAHMTQWARNQLGERNAFSWWAKQSPEIICEIGGDYWDGSIMVTSISEVMLKFNDFYSLSADQAGLLMSHLLVSSMEIAQAP